MRNKGGQLIDGYDGLCAALRYQQRDSAEHPYIFRLTLKTALLQFSSFRVTLPKDFI